MKGQHAHFNIAYDYTFKKTHTAFLIHQYHFNNNQLAGLFPLGPSHIAVINGKQTKTDEPKANYIKLQELSAVQTLDELSGQANKQSPAADWVVRQLSVATLLVLALALYDI